MMVYIAIGSSISYIYIYIYFLYIYIYKSCISGAFLPENLGEMAAAPAQSSAPAQPEIGAGGTGQSSGYEPMQVVVVNDTWGKSVEMRCMHGVAPGIQNCSWELIPGMK